MAAFNPRTRVSPILCQANVASDFKRPFSITYFQDYPTVVTPLHVSSLLSRVFRSIFSNIFIEQLGPIDVEIAISFGDCDLFIATQALRFLKFLRNKILWQQFQSLLSSLQLFLYKVTIFRLSGFVEFSSCCVCTLKCFCDEESF